MLHSLCDKKLHFSKFIVTTLGRIDFIQYLDFYNKLNTTTYRCTYTYIYDKLEPVQKWSACAYGGDRETGLTSRDAARAPSLTLTQSYYSNR